MGATLKCRYPRYRLSVVTAHTVGVGLFRRTAHARGHHSHCLHAAAYSAAAQGVPLSRCPLIALRSGGNGIVLRLLHRQCDGTEKPACAVVAVVHGLRSPCPKRGSW